MTNQPREGSSTARAGIPRWILAVFLVSALLMGLLAGRYGGSLITRDTAPQVERATILQPGKKLAAFALVDQDNHEFSLNRFNGKWSIVFFGFTHCPDICPTTLHSLSRLMDNIADTDYAEDTQVVFVSVDPARDTPEQLGRYVPFFNPDFIGLTGTIENIDSFTRDLGIAYMHGVMDEHGNYPVDHSAAILVINPSAELNAVISAPYDIGILTRDFLAIRESW
jgi:protein SCO1/2